MRRASIGTVELTSAACTVDRDRALGRPNPLPELGLTVGNNCEGLTAETPLPGIAGRTTSGGTTVDDEDEVDEEDDVAVLAAATVSVADAENDPAPPLAVATAVKATLPPMVAAVDTGTETSSS